MTLLRLIRRLSPGIAIGIGVMLGAGTASAATVGTFILGHSNNAKTVTVLHNTNKTGGAALGLTTANATAPNLSVSNTTKIPKLNADLLDGVHASAFQPRVTGSCGIGIASLDDDGAAECAAATTIYDTSGDYEYTVPDGATSVHVRMWGAGGGGGSGNNWYGGPGGGQGGNVELVVSVTPGDVLTFTVGAGGVGGQFGVTTATDGEETDLSVDGDVIATAPGGSANTATDGCPNSGLAGGTGGPVGSVTAPAIGISTAPGADGGAGDATAMCGGTDGSPGIGGGGGFAGAGATGGDADADVTADDGSDGFAILTAS
jgi:hypothetical protein